MNLEAAKRLIETLGSIAEIALDNRNKLTALEQALQKYEPNLFQAYVKNLDEVRRNPQTVISLEGFSKLQEMLVQG